MTYDPTFFVIHNTNWCYVHLMLVTLWTLWYVCWPLFSLITNNLLECFSVSIVVWIQQLLHMCTYYTRGYTHIHIFNHYCIDYCIILISFLCSPVAQVADWIEDSLVTIANRFTWDWNLNCTQYMLMKWHFSTWNFLHSYDLNTLQKLQNLMFSWSFQCYI